MRIVTLMDIGDGALTVRNHSTNANNALTVKNYSANNVYQLTYEAASTTSTVKETFLDNGGTTKIQISPTTDSYFNGGSLGVGTTAPGTTLHAITTNAVTNAVTNVLTVGHNSSGTPTTSFGTGILLQGQSDTTANRTMAQISTSWRSANDASAQSNLIFSTRTSNGSIDEIMRLTGGNAGATFGSVGIGYNNPGSSYPSGHPARGGDRIVEIRDGSGDSGHIGVWMRTNSGNIGLDTYLDPSLNKTAYFDNRYSGAGEGINAFQFRQSTSGTPLAVFTIAGNADTGSGVQNNFSFTPTIAQSGSAGYTALLVNPTESSTGSGAKRLLDLQRGGTSQFYVDNFGDISQTPTAATSGSPTLFTLTAPAHTP
jgi:hypothetical protein